MIFKVRYDMLMGRQRDSPGVVSGSPRGSNFEHFHPKWTLNSLEKLKKYSSEAIMKVYPGK